jgi:hypothetical protein
MQNYNFFLTYTTLSAKNTSVRDIFLFCTEKCMIFSLFQYFKGRFELAERAFHAAKPLVIYPSGYFYYVHTHA